jgi:hypothetical protein
MGQTKSLVANTQTIKSFTPATLRFQSWKNLSSRYVG